MADVTVKLTLGNFSVEVTGPADYVDKKLDALVKEHMASSARNVIIVEPKTSAPPPVPPVDASGKKLSAGEFLRKAPNKNQPDQALSLGYFLERFEGKQGFTSAELAATAKDARRSFANISEIISRLASRGLLMSIGDKEGTRAYALTASGEEYVESKLEPQS